MSRGERGFTLVETLVALAVLAVAAAGLVRVIEGHVDRVRGLELRATARWVAENRLAELAIAPEDRAMGSREVEMMGRQWQVATTLRASADPELRLAEIAVGPAGGTPLVRLTGFVDVGPTQ